MTGRIRVALLVLVLAGAAAGGWIWWNGRKAIDPDDADQVEAGRALYAVHCAQCHGANLEGEADWRERRPSGELPAPPHDATGHTWHHPDTQLFAITKHGLAKFAPPDYKTAMPAFIGTLKDDEIRAVLAFIKSTWPEEIRQRQENLNR